MTRTFHIGSPKLLVGCALVVLFGVSALSRLHSYYEPVNWDIATYAVIGHELDLGRSLYSDVWDIKLPPVFFSYALAERIAGYGFGEIYLLAVLTTCATTLGVCYAASTAGRVSGIVAATAFTIAAGDYRFGANRANCESFVNALMAWGFAMMIRSDTQSARWRVIASGMFFGLATLYKQFAFAQAIMVLLAHACRGGNGVPRRVALRQAAMALAVMIVLAAAVFGYFVATGRGQVFWITAVVYPHLYGGSTLRNLVSSLLPVNLFPPFMFALLPSAMLTVAAIAWPHWSNAKGSRTWLMFVALVVGTQIAIGLLNRFSPEYYVLWYVPLSIGAGWGAVSLDRLLSQRRSRWLAPAATILALAGALWIQLPAYAVPATEWSADRNGIFHTWGQSVGRELDTLVPPGETFFDWSENNVWLYFVARRSPIGPGIWRAPVVEGPLSEQLTQQTLARLVAHPPPYVVEWSSHDPDDPNAISKWIRANYDVVRHDPPRWPLVLMRRGDFSP